MTYNSAITARGTERKRAFSFGCYDEAAMLQALIDISKEIKKATGRRSSELTGKDIRMNPSLFKQRLPIIETVQI